MKKYKLCLFYSTRVHAKLIDKDFTDLRDIDQITEKFETEEKFRNDPAIKNKIDEIQVACHNYIEKIKSSKAKRGRVAIVEEENKEVRYIKPLYKVSKRYSSPKRLINSIIKRLKDENDIKLLSSFLLNFRSTFYTPFNQYRGINKMKNSLYYGGNIHPVGKKEQEYYNKVLSMMKETLEFGLNKVDDTIKEEKYFLLRIMSDYLDNHIYNDRVRIIDKDIEELENSKLNKEKSKMISSEDELYRNLIERAYQASLEKGEEPNLLGIYDDEFKDELNRIKIFLYEKRFK